MAARSSSSASGKSKGKSSGGKKAPASAGKSGKGKNVKAKISFSWKVFCAALVSMVFLFGVHTFAEYISPEYRSFFREQREDIVQKVTQTAQKIEGKFSPEPAITIEKGSDNYKYDNLTVGVPTYQCDVIIDRVGYALGYAEKYEQPLWVAYKLTADEVRSKKARRSDDFRADPDIPSGSATPEDYRGSSYDRGHLAPAADMSFSIQAMSESFYMSNMSPQTAAFNRGIWKDLEAQVRNYALYNQEIYVVTGPIFSSKEPVITIGANKVSVPDKYYKVLLDVKNARAIGFVLDNRGTKQPLKNFAVTVDEVERLTGLDFFNKLDDRSENKLESRCDFQSWENSLPQRLRCK